MKTKPYKYAFLLIGILVILCLASILYLVFSAKSHKQYTAYIYVNGKLYDAIPLQNISSPYHFTINTEDGHFNEVLVSEGSVCITAADCPDRICVKQGAVTNSLLPITCLPHKLVIELKENSVTLTQPDMIAH